MKRTKIEWTDQTDNIIVPKIGGWFCRKCSPGCDHCYAEAINQNAFFHGNMRPYEVAGSVPELKLRTDILASWSNQRKPRRHFVSSMTDVFGEWIPRSWIFRFLDAMASTPRQTFQVLTKRAGNMAEHVTAWLDERGADRIPLNIWLGFTAENQMCFNARWRKIEPLVHRLGVVFVSAEPLLEAIVLPSEFLALKWRAQVIVGGESGDEARPMHPEWVRGLQNQCDAAEVCFFFKQWGEWSPRAKICGAGTDFQSLDPQCKRWPKVIRLGEHGKDTRLCENCTPDAGEEVYVQRVGKKAAGRILDNCTWQQMPYAHGICRVCGCTEFEACEGGCYWIDSEQTLCSECDPRTRTRPVAGLSGKVGAL